MWTPRNVSVVCLTSLLATFSPACADENVPSKEQAKALRAGIGGFLTKQLGKKQEQKFAKLLAECVVAAAHPSGRGVDVTECRIEARKQGNATYTVHLKVDYFGRYSGQAYPARITLIVSKEQAEWSVDKLQFTDDRNIIAANARRLAALKESLNQCLDK